MKAQVELNLKFDQEIRSKRVTEDSRFLMKYIFAPVSERNALYKARPRVGDGVNLKILKNDDRFGQRMVGNIAETALIDDITMSKLTLTQVIKSASL